MRSPSPPGRPFDGDCNSWTSMEDAERMWCQAPAMACCPAAARRLPACSHRVPPLPPIMMGGVHTTLAVSTSGPIPWEPGQLARLRNCGPAHGCGPAPRSSHSTAQRIPGPAASIPRGGFGCSQQAGQHAWQLAPGCRAQRGGDAPAACARHGHGVPLLRDSVARCSAFAQAVPVGFGPACMQAITVLLAAGLPSDACARASPVRWRMHRWCVHAT